MKLRLLPFGIRDGPTQMAADEVMLRGAAEGQASCRLYGWSEPTASLGYFQSHHVLRGGLESLPYVRRPTGGLTLVHHHEITYALALPASHARQPAIYWLERVHRVIASVLAGLGVTTSLADTDVPAGRETSLCFHHVTRGDLTIGGAKVVGSAQRRQRGALLQHGAILLATSPFTPTLPGIEQLTGHAIRYELFETAFVATLAKALGAEIQASQWSEFELEQVNSLATERYRTPAWNEKR